MFVDTSRSEQPLRKGVLVAVSTVIAVAVRITTTTPSWATGGFTPVGSDITAEAAGDQFGQAVAISGDGTRVAIGAPGNDDNGSNAGQVRVVEESGGVWTQVGADLDGEAAGDLAGTSVALSPDGTRVAVGAAGNDGNGADAGSVRVFEESGGAWTQVGPDLDGAAAGDRFGSSLAFASDGSTLAVGAFKNPPTAPEPGYVRIMSETG